MELALHNLGGQGPVLLILHANGFLGQAYAPLAAHLQRHFCCLALDLPGQGDSNPLPQGYEVSPEACVEAVFATMAVHGLHGCFCFGHSAGGGVALLAEAARPGTFAAMYVYEPVSEPSSAIKGHPEPPGLQLAAAARRRMAVFASPEAAAQRFAARPPLSTLHPEVLTAYVTHGLRPVSTVADAGNGIQARTANGSQQEAVEWWLKCDPATEAAYFTSFMPAPHVPVGLVHCPVAVAVGTPDEGDIHKGLPQAAVSIVEGLPNAVMRRFGELRHFGPLEQPVLVAEDAAAFFQQVAAAKGPGAVIARPRL